MNKATPEDLAHLEAWVALFLKLFGALVNRTRNEQAVSQEEMAATMGLSRTEMYHLERGGTDMKLSTFIRVCRVLRCGVGAMAAQIEHLVEHPEHRPPEKPLQNQRGKNTRRSVHSR